MDCPECERLDRDETDATKEFVEAERALPPDLKEGTRAHYRWQHRRKIAKNRLDAARQRNLQHRRTHNEQH